MIVLKNVCKNYSTNRNTFNALKNVSINLENKGMTFILGKSGSGKSTLLNIIGGLDKFDNGDIIVDGKNIKNFSEHDFDLYRNTYVGFIFQNYNLIESLTIKNNILFSLRLNKVDQKIQLEKLNELTKMLNIEEIIDKYPSQCSGGQQQRAAIARALINEPKIIFADEPTGNLDSLNARELMEYLVKINEEKHTTIIMVTHDSFVASYSKKVYYMKDGHLDLSIDRLTKSQDDYYKEIVKVTTQMHL